MKCPVSTKSKVIRSVKRFLIALYVYNFKINSFIHADERAYSSCRRDNKSSVVHNFLYIETKTAGHGCYDRISAEHDGESM